jgi:hypothetical protein
MASPTLILRSARSRRDRRKNDPDGVSTCSVCSRICIVSRPGSLDISADFVGEFVAAT